MKVTYLRRGWRACNLQVQTWRRKSEAAEEGGNIKCVLAIEVIGVEERRVNHSGGPSWSLSTPPPPLSSTFTSLMLALSRSYSERVSHASRCFN